MTSDIVASLVPQTKRGGRRTTSSDTAVRTGPAGIRYPDLVVDCGPRDPFATQAIRPTLVLDVSSPGTSAIDTTDKLEEYRDPDDIRLIMLVEPALVSVRLYRRDPGGTWMVEKYDDLGEIVDLPEIGATLALVDIYDTIDPEPRPRQRLVEDAAISEPR